ncbi:MAG: hypothetical protein LBI82_08435 [Dysgonamonadaceae bacterium]|jgi:hypothetical protein|nr:hypothetical protein [Dysgonamonadaceae bacterium]
MSLALRTYSVDVPYSDLAFFNKLIGKMGWIANEKIKEPCRMTETELRCELKQSIEDAEKGLGVTLVEARKRHLAV